MNDLNYNSGLFTDHYELTMAEAYLDSGQKDVMANFDYFFRKNPFNSGFTVFAGLHDLLEMLINFKYDSEAIDFLYKKGFKSDFLEYLKTFHFSGNVYSVPEGEIVFPNEPVFRVEGRIIETQLIETLVLNVLNFQSLIASKANRIRFAAGNSLLLEFGMRRAQGQAAISASRAAIVGGMDSTSNIYSTFKYDLISSGTMAHSWIQSYDDELTAFREYVKTHPENCILLVDTYDTLESGVPNAITVAREMEQNGHRLSAIRLDSGDLAYLSKMARKQLDNAGLSYVKIVATNQLDEFIIRSLIEQKAAIDWFGVGTSVATGKSDAALDGVYKLSLVDGRPTIKLSEDPIKVTLPGEKKVLRYYNGNNKFFVDAIALSGENDKNISTIFHPQHPEKNCSVRGLESENLITKVIDKGNIIAEKKSISEISDYRKFRISQLPDEHQRFEYPHLYRVGLTKALMELRNELINTRKEKLNESIVDS